ncbi:50S ribosomal protein L21 [uncultured bacterium]|nr:50S ribosomal protein L21 [uncultured bacterium]
MFAVVEVAGKQYKVAPKDKIMVPTLNEKPGTKIRLDRVLMVGDEKAVAVGRPLVSGAVVEATLVEHAKMDKVIVFKKKRRKGYRVKRGHRQGYSQIEILSIGK